MKSPKLIGNLTPSAGVGDGKARALDNVAAPFLTAAGPGFITRKKGDFMEVQTLDEAPQAAKPLFWLLRRNAPAAVRTTTRTTTVKKIVPATAANNIIASFLALNVGANRMAYAMDDTFVPSGTTADYLVNDSWAALANLKAAGLSQRRAVTPQHIRSFFATGWDGARGAWRWGYSAKVMGLFTGSFSIGTTTAALFPCQPRVFLGDTASSVMTEATVPGEDDGRVHFGGQLFVVGPGKLCGLVCVADRVMFGDVGPADRRVTPYFLSSNDHGETWARTPAAFLLPYVRSGPFGTLHSEALRMMASMSFFAYMGEGKSLFVLRYQDPSTPFAIIAREFLYESGAFTDITSAFSSTGFLPVGRWRLNNFGTLGFADQSDPFCSDPVQYCFGPGCLAVRIVSATDPFASDRLRITRDFGASWTEATILALLGAGHYAADILVAQPYVDADRPGLIYLAAIEAGGVRFFKTDGLFASAAAVGFIPGADWSGVTLVTKTAHPYPQLLNEFGPTP